MELSIVIPSRSEMFLQNTIEDIIKNRTSKTEVIVVLDGEWPATPLPQYPDVNIIYLNKSIGQRAATNLAARLATGKYIMKTDAHCSFDNGFDTKMLDLFKEVGDEVTMVPIMRNLHAFNWKCYKCGWQKYQGPTPAKCEQCGETKKLRRKILWIGKHNPQSTSYTFDPEPHFQYFEDWKHRDPYEIDKKTKGYTETMSLQGSCFMLTRDRYWYLNICDESIGSWGNQGIEVACKSWLSGGRVLCNHNTWYAHMFRTQGGDFGFPYPQGGRDVQNTKNGVKKMFWEQRWPQQIRPVSWLVERFWPVKPFWSDQHLQELKEYEKSHK